MVGSWVGGGGWCKVIFMSNPTFDLSCGCGNNPTAPLFYRVLLLGSKEVGKTALCSQVLSSEYINTYDEVGYGMIQYQRSRPRYAGAVLYRARADCTGGGGGLRGRGGDHSGVRRPPWGKHRGETCGPQVSIFN